MKLRMIFLITVFALFSYTLSAKENRSQLVNSKHYKKVIEPVLSATAFVDENTIDKVKKRRRRYFSSYRKLPPLK